MIRSVFVGWLLAAAALAGISALTYERYQRELAWVAPSEIQRHVPGTDVRVLGRIQPGSLARDDAAGQARFVLEHEGAAVTVAYRGPDADLLRELRTIVATVSAYDGTTAQAHEVQGAPNFAYIAWAYGLTGLLLLATALHRQHRLARLRRELEGFEHHAEVYAR
jgi:cytochrome c-type biogenesis protein CcmE